MSELEERLGSILGDPEQMAQIQSLAQSLMGSLSGESGTEGPGPSDRSGGSGADGLLGSLLGGPGAGGGPDSALLGKLGGLLSRSGEDRREQALLEAMRPYLSEKRQGKLDRAMRLTRMAKLAKLAMGELEDGETL